MRTTGKNKHITAIRIFLVCALLLIVLNPQPGFSLPLPSEGPQRVVVLDVDYTIYEWWLLSWQTSQVVCQIYTENESWPDNSEVLYYCGKDIQTR